MTAILEFNLPEEREEFDLHREGPAMHSVLWDLMRWLRQKAKYEGVEKIEVGQVRAKIAEHSDEHGVDSGC